MKFLAPAFCLLLLAACHDAPASPPCRAEPLESPPLHANAGCLIFQDEKLLLLRHRFGGKLGIPGGAALEGETAQCTAHRETWEETGLDVRVGERVGRLRYGYTLYRCYPDSKLDGSRDPDLPWHAWLEVTDAVWLVPGEIPKDQWRYTDQVELFMALVGRALSSEQAETARPDQ